MWAAIERSWAPSQWAVIKDARRRQRRRQRRILAVAAALVLAAAVGWVIASTSTSAHAPTAPLVTVGAVRQLNLGGVVQGTTTLGANVWVLTCQRRCSQASSTAASVGELIELTATGRPIRRSRVADPTALTSGAGAIWIAHFDRGEVSQINPQTGQTIVATHLQLPKAVTTNGWRRFEPSGISFGDGRIWVSDGFGYVAEINPLTTRLQRMVFTSSEVTSATTAGGLTWVADELDGVGTFAAGDDHVTTHHISWAGQPVDVQTVARTAGLVWAMGPQTSYLTSLTHPRTVGVITTLDPRTGRIVHQWRVSPDAAALVVGNDDAYVGDDNHGRLLALTPPRGIQTLHGPPAARLTAATPSALWAIDRNRQLIRISLTHR